MNTPVIRINDLRKRYKTTEALRRISLDVYDGEILAFLGPNGAGKTTAINILTGLLRQNGGEIYYGGVLFDPENPSQKSVIGVVPQSNNLDRDLTVEQNLKVHGILFGMKGRALSDRIDEVLGIVDLIPQKHRRAVELSGGMKRRLVIARALLHSPRILFLDEPSTGLDPVTRRKIHTLIRRLSRQEKVCVFLTTHYIEEADWLADRVVFISHGRIVASGKGEELKASIGRYALEYMQNDSYQTLYFEDRGQAVKAAEKYTVDVQIREVTLEDVYIKLTGQRMENGANDV